MLPLVDSSGRDLPAINIRAASAFPISSRLRKLSAESITDIRLYPLEYAPVMFLRSCPFCGCVVQGYQQLQSREALEKLKALEYEGAGLKAQLESFRRRVSFVLTW